MPSHRRPFSGAPRKGACPAGTLRRTFFFRDVWMQRRAGTLGARGGFPCLQKYLSKMLRHAVASSVALACSEPVAQGITVPPWVVTAPRSALSLTDLLADVP